MPTFKVSNRCPANNRKEEKQKGADTRKAPMDMFGNLFMQTDNNHEEKEGAALLH